MSPDPHHKPLPVSSNMAEDIRDPPPSLEDPDWCLLPTQGCISSEVKSKEHLKFHFVNHLLSTLDFEGTPGFSWIKDYCSMKSKHLICQDWQEPFLN